MRKFWILGAVLIAVLLALGEVFFLPMGSRGQTMPAPGRSPSSVSEYQPVPVEASMETMRNAGPVRYSDPLMAAEEYVRSSRVRWGLKEYHELKGSVFKTPLGAEVKFQVYQDDLPILGQEILLRIRPGRDAELERNSYVPLGPAVTDGPRLLSVDDVLGGLRTSSSFVTVARREDVSRVLVPSEGAHAPELAYVVPVRDAQRRPVQLLIRAADGQVLRRVYSRSEF